MRDCERRRSGQHIAAGAPIQYYPSFAGTVCLMMVLSFLSLTETHYPFYYLLSPHAPSISSLPLHTLSLLMSPPSHLSPSTPSHYYTLRPPLISSPLLSSAPRLCGDVCEFQGDDVTALFRSSAPRSHLTPRWKDQVSYLSYLW